MFVFELTEAVPATILAAREVEAFNTFVFVVLIFVLAVVSELPSEVDALPTVVFTLDTFELTAANVAPNEVEAKSV